MHGYYLSPSVSEKAVRADAERVLARGEHVTIHHHPHGATCGVRCELLHPPIPGQRVPVTTQLATSA